MNHRTSLIALSASTLVFVWLLAGCGDYDDDDPAAGGDTSTGGGGDTTMGGSDTGTGAGPGICDNVTPCGGDVVGTWNVTGSCLAVSGVLDVRALGLGETCNATVTTGTLEVTGTWTAVGDGTFMDGTTSTGTETIELTEDCKQLSGTETICDRISGPLAAGGYENVTCIDNPATNGCTCSATINQIGSETSGGGIGVVPGYPSANGNYTIAGNTLTFTAGVQEYSYCVSGTTLTMTPVSTGATGTLTGSVVLQRQ